MLAVLCHKFLIDLFYGFIFYLFEQEEILISGNLGFKAHVPFSGMEHVPTGYLGFPEIQQPSEITASCPSWANFKGLRQACSIVIEGDFQ